MTSRKDDKAKATKKKASVAKQAAKKHRTTDSKVLRKKPSPDKAFAKPGGVQKIRDTKAKKGSQPKLGRKTETMTKRNVAAGHKKIHKPKTAPKPKTPAKVRGKITKIKSPGLVQKKNPMPMSKDKEDDFRTAFMKSLKLKKQELEQDLERLMKSRKEYEGQLTAGDFIDEVDDAQREISAYSQFSLIERKNKELQKIEYLLNRIAEEKDFGICEECGTRIPKERLLLVPEATLCVACQRELEKMDSRMSMATRPSGFSPTRREVTWETNDVPDEDDNLLVEYHIGAMPDGDMDESDLEAPAEDKDDKDA